MTGELIRCDGCLLEIAPGEERWFDLVDLDGTMPPHVSGFTPVFHKSCMPVGNPMYVRRLARPEDA
ncbi:hypothetical protein acdb102_31340 [Acidothermaceae bacterium B102]|nr:hypothetical protein acdb102_31340 [Acidothermaceae bacterium B102]